MYAAHVGNKHAAARITAFFHTMQEAYEAAKLTDHDDWFISFTSNWQEHQQWNKQRIGMYADMPVNE